MIGLLTLCLLGVSPSDGNTAHALMAQDTLRIQTADGDTEQLLNELRWPPAAFKVEALPTPDKAYDALVRFPSPRPIGKPLNDLVALEWYQAKSSDGKPVVAPAVVVVHESGKGMQVGRAFAMGLQQLGLHTFLIHLPNYGERAKKGTKTNWGQLVPTVRQALADVRRAKDAIARLPHIKSGPHGVLGISLGGFVSVLASGLDDGFDHVFILLAGGNMYEILSNGKRDAANARRELAEHGYEGDKLKELLWQIEPLRLAPRISPQKAWLFSATQDTVVPLANSIDLAEAIKLPKEQHVKYWANHYSGVLYMPSVMHRVCEEMGVDYKSRRQQSTSDNKSETAPNKTSSSKTPTNK